MSELTFSEETVGVLILEADPGTVLEVSAPRGPLGPTGPTGPTGPLGPAGIIVSPTAPADPVLNQLWLQIPEGE